jgi:ABC-type dipeptide/oligopeptide/nickel transport system ATPase subunit
MSVLEITRIVKSYGALRAVDDVTFRLEEGDNMAIIGESGCGKTTLAKIIMGLTAPDSGSIKSQKRSLQMVFQDPYQSLDPLWNVREILKEALCLERIPPALMQEKMEQMLVNVGLSPGDLWRFPHEFSGGERQRIAIARSLLASPKVLVLDEAVSALDTLVQKQIMDLLRKLKRDFNLTYIFISHNLRLVKNFSEKIMVMYNGKIIEEGGAAAVLRSPSHPYTQQLLKAAYL